MMTRKLAKLGWASLALLSLLGQAYPAEGQIYPNIGEPDLVITGSTTMQPLVQKMAQAFLRKHPEVRIEVSGGGSEWGIKAAYLGIADIGMCSEKPLPEDSPYLRRAQVPGKNYDSTPYYTYFQELTKNTIAYDAICIIVNKLNDEVSDLSSTEIVYIFSSGSAYWGSEPVVVVTREEGSGTKATFEQMVMKGQHITGRAISVPSNEQMLRKVASNFWSIGYISRAYLTDAVKAISIDGIEPSLENCLSGRYPLLRPLFLLTYGEPQGLAREFIQFCQSEVGQAIASSMGYIPLSESIQISS